MQPLSLSLSLSLSLNEQTLVLRLSGMAKMSFNQIFFVLFCVVSFKRKCNFLISLRCVILQLHSNSSASFCLHIIMRVSTRFIELLSCIINVCRSVGIVMFTNAVAKPMMQMLFLSVPNSSLLITLCINEQNIFRGTVHPQTKM